ncbi:hypothetical protein QBC46DRAFT_339952 [Diplogelasinospora grovesii]|uniref:Uncharacterized protein n=1 Tax=Diplogelasinospora grovesii TaxID=303347 RepID=A0AAN6NBA4_9PEZI|nr:hypothetical protein QBC46DRAFT_339952 [Diplogelasinospora grovesii]
MKFIFAAVFALAAVVAAYSDEDHDAFIRRQANNIQQMDPSVPAMTDQNGNVIPFDAANVYQDALAKGL